MVIVFWSSFLYVVYESVLNLLVCTKKLTQACSIGFEVKVTLKVTPSNLSKAPNIAFLIFEKKGNGTKSSAHNRKVCILLVLSFRRTDQM